MLDGLSLSLLSSSSDSQHQTLRVGDAVVARFTADNILYRGKITRVAGDRVTVMYVDYGNNEALGRDRVWAVPQVKTSLEMYPPLATQIALAFLSPSVSGDFSNDATLCLRTFVQDYEQDRPLKARVEYTDGYGRKYVTLRTANNVTAQEHLILCGLARLEGRFLNGNAPPSLIELAKPLERSQEKAKANRMNIWQYGEVYSDEEN
jgi:endonuclease YncB( thermonuclease family)